MIAAATWSNTSEHLEGFDDESVDFVYSSIALQHSPARYQVAYLREFLRVLKTGGLAVLQFRIGSELTQGSPRALWRRFFSESLKPWWKKLRGRPPVQVHVIGEPTVRAAVGGAGGRVIAVGDADERKRQNRRSLRFVIVKD